MHLDICIYICIYIYVCIYIYICVTNVRVLNEPITCALPKDGDSVGNGICHKLGGRRQHTHTNFLQTLEREAFLGCRGSRNGAKENGIGCGKIFERHTYRCLAAKVVVEFVGVAQLRERYRRDHAAVAVQH